MYRSGAALEVVYGNKVWHIDLLNEGTVLKSISNNTFGVLVQTTDISAKYSTVLDFWWGGGVLSSLPSNVRAMESNFAVSKPKSTVPP
jgi:hypothetical protein